MHTHDAEGGHLPHISGRAIRHLQKSIKALLRLAPPPHRKGIKALLRLDQSSIKARSRLD
jgi:hypothetical protein